MRLPPLSRKRQAGLERSRVSKFTVSFAMAIWLCDVTLHGEGSRRYSGSVAVATRSWHVSTMTASRPGCLSDYHGAVLTRRKGTSYDALVAHHALSEDDASPTRQKSTTASHDAGVETAIGNSVLYPARASGVRVSIFARSVLSDLRELGGARMVHAAFSESLAWLPQ